MIDPHALVCCLSFCQSSKFVKIWFIFMSFLPSRWGCTEYLITSFTVIWTWSEGKHDGNISKKCLCSVRCWSTAFIILMSLIWFVAAYGTMILFITSSNSAMNRNFASKPTNSLRKLCNHILLSCPENATSRQPYMMENPPGFFGLSATPVCAKITHLEAV